MGMSPGGGDNTPTAVRAAATAPSGRAAPAPRATTLSVASWVLYDLANTIFSLGVVSLYFSLWVRDAVGPLRADGVYGSVMAVSMGMVFFLSPLLGTMSDRARTRMPFLVTSTMICVVATALLARIGTIGTFIAFIIANAAFQAGMQFYDALLPDVSTEENRGRISGVGVGVGYMGSYAAVSIGLVVGSANKPNIFLTIAISFLVLALPCFLFVRERGNPAPSRVFHVRDLVRSLATTITTLRQGQRYPGLSRFLLGRIFYTDAINTVVAIMTLFAVNVGVSRGLAEEDATRMSEMVLLGSIGCAVVGGFAWGWLVDRLGPKRTLTIVLALWMLDFALAALMALAGLPLWVLYIVTAIAGVALGGTWASDRPLMLRLTPPDRVGEFYGFYNMVGRFSAVIGPTLWAIVAKLTIGRGMAPERGQGIGILLLLGMIVVSWLIIRRVDDRARAWGASQDA